jgi:hypothetical protein
MREAPSLKSIVEKHNVESDIIGNVSAQLIHHSQHLEFGHQ